MNSPRTFEPLPNASHDVIPRYIANSLSRSGSQPRNLAVLILNLIFAKSTQ
jgi:hypothetical protein